MKNPTIPARFLANLDVATTMQLEDALNILAARPMPTLRSRSIMLGQRSKIEAECERRNLQPVKALVDSPWTVVGYDEYARIVNDPARYAYAHRLIARRVAENAARSAA